MNMPSRYIWLTQPSPPRFNERHQLLDIPKELLLEIVLNVAVSPGEVYPKSLIQLSKTCRYLHHLIHKDPWSQAILWPRAFKIRFDTRAIYRRQLNHQLDWQRFFERRYNMLATCQRVASALLAQQPQELIGQLDFVDWEVIWYMITEHDALNIPLLLNHQVHLLAGAAFQLGAFRDREVYPVVLPILSLLVNYDFTVTRFFTSEISPHTVSQELSQFAYDFEADTLITKHMSPRPFHSEFHQTDSSYDVSPPDTFYPAQDPLTSAFHLFFATVFACHPAPYHAIPNCSPIPLFPLTSDMFDVEFLRRYERKLFLASLRESRDAWHEKHHKIITASPPKLENIYSATGFASSSHFVSEAHLIEGEWMGYYSFLDTTDDDDGSEYQPPPSTASDWFDGPMRITLRIVPLEEETLIPWQPSDNCDKANFPACHLRTCPLTRFEGHGIDNLGEFNVTGLIDDSEDGQITWEKTYIESEETWEYAGRFTLPMGICGRWGDEQYGGPWWIWKITEDEVAPPVASASSSSTK
ncbi:hypothetical protein BJV82DRAFT_672465 [Fennellomyces sp. T-0311]|nr:hypothetical protein BJV82DRAFT_672465 [Fennellomyces sp. T-0311]